MTGLQFSGIKIKGELILNLPEKFKLGRVSTISWLVEKGKHRPVSAPHIYCSVIHFFCFRTEVALLHEEKMPSIFPKRQTANFTGIGQVTLSLEEV